MSVDSPGNTKSFAHVQAAAPAGSSSPGSTSESSVARHIVVVEDQVDMAEAIAARLRSEGFLVSLAFDGPSGVSLCNEIQPDAVVLDINLPGFDGLEVCRQIQRERHVPVVMLTARDSEMDMLVGLAVGADDYITKPFSPRELVARIHALLRRTSARTLMTTAQTLDEGSSQGMFRHLGVVLDATNRTVEFNDTQVHLTVTEFDLSCWFLQHPKVVFTREQLLRSVWGYADGSGERTVDSHVQAVRKKLGPDFVRTVHGVGYSLGALKSSEAT
jgi:DNA-binding response OmpR family regulator